MAKKHICKKCKMEFDKKYDFDRHINRVTDCVTGKKTKKIKKHVCEDCKNKFARKDILDRHIKTCKKRIENIKIKKTIKGNKNTAIENSKNCLNTNNNNNNLTLQLINLVVFAKDGIKNLTPYDFKEIFNSNRSVFEAMITNVNLNPNKPEHHNILYKDMKSPCGEVYENGTWVRKKIDEMLETLIDAKIDDLEEILSEMGDFVSEKSRNKIREAIKNMDYGRPGARKKLKSYLKPILYNHKDMIIKTRKLTKEQEEEIFRKEQEEAEREADEEEREIKRKKKLQDKKKIPNKKKETGSKTSKPKKRTNQKNSSGSKNKQTKKIIHTYNKLF